jgi:hypothetical protein
LGGKTRTTPNWPETADLARADPAESGCWVTFF